MARSLIILCMYFAYRGCYRDYITYTSEIPSRKNKRVTFKTKNDTKQKNTMSNSFEINRPRHETPEKPRRARENGLGRRRRREPRRGGADKTLKSGPEAVNTHRSIARTSMCRHIKYVFLKISMLTSSKFFLQVPFFSTRNSVFSTASEFQFLARVRQTFLRILKHGAKH